MINAQILHRHAVLLGLLARLIHLEGSGCSAIT